MLGGHDAPGQPIDDRLDPAVRRRWNRQPGRGCHTYPHRFTASVRAHAWPATGTTSGWEGARRRKARR